jgi:hypothetical protein
MRLCIAPIWSICVAEAPSKISLQLVRPSRPTLSSERAHYIGIPADAKIISKEVKKNGGGSQMEA